ncbi:hypothetical protein KS4_35730 [Poriferisphaera corsica]|uniref:Uncharacterized protein n=1 Tax=Poriferisphaera corsica TaxID=2528020 RepID=A0A517YZ38_9BACT|nr:choice-of-anchor K domain-containing protein [Poriferisphaera corsica]QDU35490.1 hypothetical protein KS4_35730 [Poriferisphaera corsica]
MKFPTMTTLTADMSSLNTKASVFEIGRISHYHNPADREAIDLTVTLQFDHPNLDRRVFTFALESKNNHHGRDTIYITHNDVSRCSFQLETHTYAVRLLGFGNDPLNLTRSTQMHKATHNTEKLFAEFIDITNPKDVTSAPLAEPFTILGLIAVQRPH